MYNDLEPLADGNETTGVSVHSGFPNPAADNRGRQAALALDLNQLLIRHPSSTYLFRIRGHIWAEQGIFDGDIAIIDRTIGADPQDLVLIWEDDQFEIHRRRTLDKRRAVWGTVSAVIHPYRTPESL